VRSLRLVKIILLSGLVAAIIVSRKPIRASAALPQPRVLQRGGTLTSAGVSSLQAIVDSARNEGLRWPSFVAYKTEFKKL
jgi:hypothetical protein